MNPIFLLHVIGENNYLTQLVFFVMKYLIAILLLIIAIKYLPTLIGNLIKIWSFKRNGFLYSQRLIFDDGKILLYGLRFDIEEIHNYYSVIIIDKNFNILNSQILGIGDDVEYNNELIRIVTMVDNNFLVGFINKRTGIIEISFQFKKAKPFYQYCNISGGYEKIYSKVLFPGKDSPNYINTEGELIQDENFFGCPQA